MKFTKKDNIIIIGAGKVSYSLAPSLSDAGYKIKLITSNKIKDAKELAGRLKVCKYNVKLEGSKITRGIFILAVPDTQIKKTANRISKLNIDFSKSLFIHLSGSNDITLLKSLALKKGNTASLHIMQTFPSRRQRNIKGSYVGIETKSKEVSAYLFKLTMDLDLRPFNIASRDKVIYHLAGVYASNFINGVLFQSQQLFNRLGLKEYTFNDVLAPLYNSTIKNIYDSSPEKALSGPVERGDIDTVKMHIKELKRKHGKGKEILFSYLALSLSLIEATEAKYGELNIGQKAIKEILLKETDQISNR